MAKRKPTMPAWTKPLYKEMYRLQTRLAFVDEAINSQKYTGKNLLFFIHERRFLRDGISHIKGKLDV